MLLAWFSSGSDFLSLVLGFGDAVRFTLQQVSRKAQTMSLLFTTCEQCVLGCLSASVLGPAHRQC